MPKKKFENNVSPDSLAQHITVDSRGMHLVVKVKPGAARERLFISEMNELILAVRAPALNDKANDRVIEIMSQIFMTNKSHVEIESGRRVSIKRILVDNS